MKIKQLLEDAASRHADKAALIYQGQTITFQQLRNNVFKLANGLKSQGLTKSDKVGIYLSNCPEYVYSYLAVFCLGAVGVPLDFMLKKDELISCLSHAEVKFLIAQDKDDASLREVQNGVPTLKRIVFCHT